MSTSAWEPDVLGGGFESLTLELQPDFEGDVVATLVKAPTPAPLTLFQRWRKQTRLAENTDVLYVHGWSDYFFQRNLAQYWQEQGAQFYALDLRKYGRSIRPGQMPGYVDDLAVYDEEIEAALEVMGHGKNSSNPRKLILLGHSTGGLIFSLWVKRNPGRVDALVLNSPWLEYQLTAATRKIVAPVLKAGQKIVNPTAKLPSIDFGFYSRTVDYRQDGEWDFNLEWRPEHGFAVRPAWLRAILDGHAEVAEGLNIDIPIFVWLSTKSLLVPRWSPAMMKADVAIDVDIVADRVPELGYTVTLARVPDAIHDVVLSAAPVRDYAFAQLSTWLKGYL